VTGTFVESTVTVPDAVVSAAVEEAATTPAADPDRYRDRPHHGEQLRTAVSRPERAVQLSFAELS